MIQHTKPALIVPEHLPQRLLSETIGRVVHELYGFSWAPRIVRQSRRLSIGSLKHVDYAIPCFELSKLLNKPVHLIVNEIVGALIAQDETSTYQLYLVEGVSGYVNIQLNEAYFSSSATGAANLYRRIHTRRTQSDIELLIVNQNIFETKEVATTQLAYKYIYQLSRLLDIRIVSTQYIADNSEQVSQRLMTELGDVIGLRRRQELFRDIKNFLMSPKAEQEVHPLGRDVRKLLRHSSAERNRIMRSIHPTSHTVVHEYELVESVHDFLDNFPFKTAAFSLVHDPCSSAVFLDANDDSIALRSAEGMLLHAAYAVYALGRAIIDGVETPQATLVVVSPHKQQSMIRTVIDGMLLHYGVEKRVVFFDPMTSYADIDEIFHYGSSVLPTIKRLKNLLRSINYDGTMTDEIRHSLLELIDSPIELRSRLTEVQLPAFFDALNGSIRALDSFDR